MFEQVIFWSLFMLKIIIYCQNRQYFALKVKLIILIL